MGVWGMGQDGELEAKHTVSSGKLTAVTDAIAAWKSDSTETNSLCGVKY